MILDGLLDALRDGSVEAVDLSHTLSSATPMIELPDPFANAPGFALEELAAYDERGPAWRWNAIHGAEHQGTHFDAPVHWVTGRDGRDLSQIPAADLIVYYPSKRNQTIRARAFIDFLVEHFRVPQDRQSERGKGRERKRK